jgi:hypothetical protein
MLEINIPEVVAEVTQAFRRYERALVDNDVAALDGLFWNSPNTLRFGIGENLYGYEAISAYRNGRPPIDLTRQLNNTVIVSYGRDLATANTEFQRPRSKMSGRCGAVSFLAFRRAGAIRFLANQAENGHLSLVGSPEEVIGRLRFCCSRP